MTSEPGFQEAKSAAIEYAQEIMDSLKVCNADISPYWCRLQEMAGIASELEELAATLRNAGIARQTRVETWRKES